MRSDSVLSAGHPGGTEGSEDAWERACFVIANSICGFENGLCAPKYDTGCERCIPLARAIVTDLLLRRFRVLTGDDLATERLPLGPAGRSALSATTEGGER
jgi:hypothetical protein